MISFLSGKLFQKNANKIVLDVNGVGYEVSISTYTLEKLPEIGSTVSMFCHMVFREDAQILFGFFEELERAIFRELIKVNGVGPKVGMAILSTLPPKLLIKSIQDKALDNLMSVPGIGKKSAERLMIELTGSIDKVLVEFGSIILDGDILHTKASLSSSNEHEASTALLTLGFKQHAIKKAILEVDTSALSSQDIIKQALRLLSR